MSGVGTPPDGSLRASYAACAELTRARARNFYYGLRLAPEPRRSSLYAIYAWMRLADDGVDDAPTPAAARERLARYREQTDTVLGGGMPEGPIWAAFADTLARYPIRHGWLSDMLDGLAGDIDGVAIECETDLDRYAYCVAGTAGLCCVAVWGLRPGVDEADAHRLAIERGQAFQRTNILRDLGEDLGSSPRRCYVPADALAKHGLTPEALCEWADPERCEALVAERVAEAEARFAASAGLERQIDPACAPVSRSMTRIYRGVLDRVRRQPQAAALGPRPGLGRPIKIAIGLAGLAERMVRR